MIAAVRRFSMNKLFALGLCVALVGCAEKAPLSPEEQWKGYCTSVGNAGRTIMLDRQNGIEKEKAVEHANKVEDETTRGFVLDAIEQVYAMPLEQINNDVKASREAFKVRMTQACLSKPFTALPDYKPF